MAGSNEKLNPDYSGEFFRWKRDAYRRPLSARLTILHRYFSIYRVAIHGVRGTSWLPFELARRNRTRTREGNAAETHLGARAYSHGLSVGFQQPRGPSVASEARSNSFSVLGKSYKGRPIRLIYFQSLKDGTLLALVENRRSGAQRGASENNFGQRFSVSTPCLNSPKLRQPSPPSFSPRLSVADQAAGTPLFSTN